MRIAIRIGLILGLLGAAYLGWQKFSASRANDRGVQAINSGDFFTAAAELEIARKADPNNIKMLRNLGYAYEQTGQRNKAINAYEAVIRLDAAQTDIQERLSVLKENQGLAARAAERVSRLKYEGWKPDADLQVTLDTAEVEFQVGNWPEAIVLYERALFLEPEDMRTLKIESRIEYMEQKIEDGTAP